MRFKKALLFSALVIFFTCAAYAESKPMVVGVYKEVPGKKFKFDGKKVEIIEFLSFYCGHCYKFEKSIPVIKGNFPKKIIWKTIPVYWGKGSPKPGEAYMLAEQAGKGELMKKEIFHAIFVEGKNIGSIEVLETIGMEIGLGFDFSLKLRSGEMSKKAEEAMKTMKMYGVDETPTIIIAGNLKVAPGMLKGNVELMRDNTLVMLKSLLRK
jgi:thiol:disulfide interchange protein DsbA